jgi:hypothetical protein
MAFTGTGFNSSHPDAEMVISNRSHTSAFATMTSLIFQRQKSVTRQIYDAPTNVLKIRGQPCIIPLRLRK